MIVTTFDKKIGCKFDYIQVPSGVPQGPHVGPCSYKAYTCLINSRHLLNIHNKNNIHSFVSVEQFICLL